MITRRGMLLVLLLKWGKGDTCMRVMTGACAVERGGGDCCGARGEGC